MALIGSSQAASAADTPLRAVDGAFTVFVMQRGPIESTVQLLEFLLSVRAAAELPTSVITPRHIEHCAHVWHETHEEPMTRLQCREFVSALRELSSARFIQSSDVQLLFSTLAQGSEFLATGVLIAVLRALASRDGHLADLVAELAVSELADDSLSCALLQELCDAYFWMSALLNEHKDDILIACEYGSGDTASADTAPASPASSSIRSMLSQEIAKARSEYAASRLSHRSQQQKRGGVSHGARPSGTTSSVFYPLGVAVTNGVGQRTDSLLAPIHARIADPTTAMEVFVRSTPPQTLVQRVADLRKIARQRELRQQRALRADIVHAVYEATDLATLEQELGSRPSILRRMALESLGDDASRRLYPHQRSPRSSMREKLQSSLGVALPSNDDDDAGGGASHTAATLLPEVSPFLTRLASSVDEAPARQLAARVESSLRTIRLDRSEGRIVERRGRSCMSRLAYTAASFFSPGNTMDREPMQKSFGLRRQVGAAPSSVLDRRRRPTPSGTRISVASLTRPTIRDLQHELQVILADVLNVLSVDR